jgi:hypothetical protein
MAITYKRFVGFFLILVFSVLFCIFAFKFSNSSSFLIPIIKSQIPCSTKLELIKKVFKVHPSSNYQQASRFFNLQYSFNGNEAHRLEAILFTVEFNQWSSHMLKGSWPLQKKMLNHYGGWSNILERIQNPGFYHALENDMKEVRGLTGFFEISMGKARIPRFLLNWTFDEDLKFYYFLRANEYFKSQKGFNYRCAQFFSEFDQSKLPVSLDLASKISNLTLEIKFLKNSLEDWPYLKNGHVILNNKEDYQALEALWRLFLNLNEEAYLNEKIQDIAVNFGNQWKDLSYAVESSAAVSPQFKARILQAIDPIYISISTLSVQNEKEFINAIKILTFLKELYLIDKQYNKYLEYGRNLAFVDIKTYIPHIKEIDLEGFLNLVEFKDNDLSKKFMGQLMEKEFPQFINLTNPDSQKYAHQILQRLKALSPTLEQEFIVFSVDDFLKRNQVASDNMSLFINTTRAWRGLIDDVMDHTDHQFYQLIGSFIANDVYRFLNIHHIPRENIEREFNRLGIKSSYVVTQDQNWSKLASNIVHGNWRYVFYKLWTNIAVQENVSNEVLIGSNKEIHLPWPDAYQVKDILFKNKKIANLFLINQSKGARVAAMKFNEGTTTTKGFMQAYPQIPLALDFTIDFTTEDGRTKDLAIEKGQIKNWLISINRAHALVVVYKNGLMKILDKRYLRISDLYLNSNENPYPDRNLNLRSINDYFLFLTIAKDQELSITANILLINGETVNTMPPYKGAIRLLLEFSDGEIGILNATVYSDINSFTRLAKSLELENQAKVSKAVYLDTGLYDYFALHTTDKGEVILGQSNNPFSSNRIYWGHSS